MGRGGARKGAGRPSGDVKTKPIRVPEHMISAITEFVAAEGYQLPLYSSKVSAGLPSSAEDDIDKKLDLNKLLIQHPADTFFVRVSGESMLNAGIHPDDILVIDKSIKPSNGKIVIAAIDGYLTVKRLVKTENGFQLHAENAKYKPIILQENNDVHIWGVVTNVIHPV